jgi:pimeloyl-ACP methyl ester carboxylesterase
LTRVARHGEDQRVAVETVESKDGTPIACVRSGDGPPLVYIHGLGVDHREFDLTVAPWLREHFSVWAVERRGRGASGDSPAYAVEREFEDLAAVADAIHEPVHLYGLSFGATVVLGALPLMTNVNRAVLYDPRAFVGHDLESATAWIESVQGEGEAKLMSLYTSVVADDDDRLGALREIARDPRLPATLRREATALDEWTFDPSAYAGVVTPLLFLTGSESPPVHHRTIELACAALPHSQVTVLEGHGHVAGWTAPEFVARGIIDFLQGAGSAE